MSSRWRIGAPLRGEGDSSAMGDVYWVSWLVVDLKRRLKLLIGCNCLLADFGFQSELTSNHANSLHSCFKDVGHFDKRSYDHASFYLSDYATGREKIEDEVTNRRLF